MPSAVRHGSATTFQRLTKHDRAQLEHGDVVALKYATDGAPEHCYKLCVQASSASAALTAASGASAQAQQASPAQQQPTRSRKRRRLARLPDAPSAAGSGVVGSNPRIIAVFEEMSKIYKVVGDRNRAKAYTDAAAAVRSQQSTIVSGAEAKKLPGIGKQTAVKIDEILATGKLAKLEELRAAHSSQIQLSRVHGIGPVAASKLIAAHGVTSVAELQAACVAGRVPLSEQQRIGLALCDDLELRIPRAEVTDIGALVSAAAAAIDPDIEITVCGSYRRGAATSGDIDVLVTHPEFTKARPRRNPLKRLVARLKEQGILTHHFVEGTSKYQGVCQLNTSLPHRRIDILATECERYFTAICYFTGSGAFNRALRQHAAELGYTLNEHELRRNAAAEPGRKGLSPPKARAPTAMAAWLTGSSPAKRGSPSGSPGGGGGERHRRTDKRGEHLRDAGATVVRPARARVWQMKFL